VLKVPVDNRLQERILILKMEIKGSSIEVGSLSDLFDGCRCYPLFVSDFNEGVQQKLAGVLHTPTDAPLWGRHRFSSCSCSTGLALDSTLFLLC
jgi:hypothetical protein